MGFFMIDAMAKVGPWKAFRLTGRDNATASIMCSRDQDIPFYGVRSGVSATGSSMFKEATEFYTDVPAKMRHCRTLDNLLARQRWPSNVELLKLDVQGSELEVLKGSSNLLKHVQVVSMEMNFAVVYNHGAPSFADYIIFMDSIGFAPFDIIEQHRLKAGILLQIDMLFVRKQSRWTAIAQDV